jgi:hypothetical protein
LKDTLLDKESSSEELKSEIESLKETLALFKLDGKYSTQSEREKYVNKFSTVLSESKVLSKVVSFLIPREMLELSLTSKLINS